MLKTVFMFPGQGSQKVGMGKDLADNISEIKDLYDKANDIVGYDLAEICFNGPEERLNMTDISQPAIYVTSAACLMAMRMGKAGSGELVDLHPDVCAGLSLGEYTALYVAGALTFEEGLKLVQVRGRSMQDAAEQRAGTMVTLLGLDEETVKGLCKAVLEEDGGVSEDDGLPAILDPVNYNCPGQIVLSGSIRACHKAAERAEEFGASKAVVLKVAGAFHTSMMAPAAERLQAALQTVSVSELTCKVIANTNADYYNRQQPQLPEKLMNQLTGPVLWQHSIERLLDESEGNIERFAEIGPGRVLTGLVKKIMRPRKLKIAIDNVNGLAE